MKTKSKNTSASALDKKISAFEESRNEGKNVNNAVSSNTASRAGYELLIAIAFFSIIGFALDKQLNTLPWITLGFFFLGFATGVYNAWRAMNVNSEKVGAIREKYTKPPAAKKPPLDPASEEDDEDGSHQKPHGSA